MNIANGENITEGDVLKIDYLFKISIMYENGSS